MLALQEWERGRNGEDAWHILYTRHQHAKLAACAVSIEGFHVLLRPLEVDVAASSG